MIPSLLLACTVSSVAEIPAPREFSRPLVELFEAQWPKNRTVTIVCHGHSVPAGYFKTPDVRSQDAYPHLLFLAIKRKYPFAVVNVIVTAIGGENSLQGTKRFARDVLSLRPDVVTIDYSLNDRSIGLDRARESWEEMILASQKAKAQVILLTPSWDTGSDINVLNQHALQVRSLAKTYGTGLADSFDAFDRSIKNGKGAEAFMSQPNHPNRTGHELIVDRLLPWFGITERSAITATRLRSG